MADYTRPKDFDERMKEYIEAKQRSKQQKPAQDEDVISVHPETLIDYTPKEVSHPNRARNISIITISAVIFILIMLGIYFFFL